MERKISFFLIAFCVILVLGCGVTHVKIPPATPQQEAFAKAFIPKKGKALIYLIRPYIFCRTKGSDSILINNEPFGIVSVGTYIYANVDPGIYVIAWGAFKQWGVFTQIDVKAGKSYFITHENCWMVKIAHIDEAEGRNLITRYKLSRELVYENRRRQ